MENVKKWILNNSGYDDGDGFGRGNGDGWGYSYGSGYGSGCGYGSGFGDGDGTQGDAAQAGDQDGPDHVARGLGLGAGNKGVRGKRRKGGLRGADPGRADAGTRLLGTSNRGRNGGQRRRRRGGEPRAVRDPLGTPGLRHGDGGGQLAAAHKGADGLKADGAHGLLALVQVIIERLLRGGHIELYNTRLV